MAQTVGELGEQAVLTRILEWLRPASQALIGPGDDCAVLRFSGDVAVTSDTMIEGADFNLDWHTPVELGWKLAATNLSDVAAMGANPVALTVSLACPPSTPVAVLEGIAQGLQQACDELAPGCSVVGGDLASARQVIGAVTALGDHGGVPPVTRAGAVVGDRVAYAGSLGLSGIGLRALFAHGVAARDREAGSVRAHLTPVVPVALGRVAAVAGASAMMDVSDGLSLDAARMGRASQATLDLSSMMLQREFGEQDGVTVSVHDMLTGGEDHGLLATFPPNVVIPEGFNEIGTVRAKSGDLLLDGTVTTPRGWDSLAAS